MQVQVQRRTLPQTTAALSGYLLRLTLSSTSASAKSSGPLAIAPTKSTSGLSLGTARSSACGDIARASAESAACGGVSVSACHKDAKPEEGAFDDLPILTAFAGR